MLPVVPVTRPSALTGQTNGRVAPDRMRTVTTPGGDATLVAPAANAWQALEAAARDAGHTLVPYSTYRSFESQEKLFLSRYKTTPKAGVDTKSYLGKTWYLWSGEVTAAPGTSNHGWGLALDLRVRRMVDGQWRTYTMVESPATLGWLVANEHRWGFSHEIQSEKWHIRYFAGDSYAPPPQEDPLMAAADDILEAIASLRTRVDDRSGLIVNTINGRTGAIINLVREDDVDEAAIVAGVLAGITPGSLSDEQVTRIIDAIPEQVKVAMREGAGG